MAVITETLMTGAGDREITQTTLSASDTFTYRQGKKQVLTVTANVTSGTVTLNVLGSSASTLSVDGVGSVDLSAGFSIGPIASGETFSVPLDTIREYLSGTIALTGGASAVATLTGY